MAAVLPAAAVVVVVFPAAVLSIAVDLAIADLEVVAAEAEAEAEDANNTFRSRIVCTSLKLKTIDLKLLRCSSPLHVECLSHPQAESSAIWGLKREGNQRGQTNLDLFAISRSLCACQPWNACTYLPFLI